MKTLMTTLLAVILMASGSTASGQVSIGIRIGPPPPPRVVRVLPARPGPEWVWVQGYWYPVGRHYRWHEGYWTRPPYPGAHWVVPRYKGGEFFEGYWGVIVGGLNMTTAGTVIETGITTGTATMTDTSRADRRKKQPRKRSPDAMSTNRRAECAEQGVTSAHYS
jgi:hypothetical protein